MQHLFSTLFADFFIICTKVDKASKNASFACPFARAITTLNFLIPDRDTIRNYANATDSAAIERQLQTDTERILQLETTHSRKNTTTLPHSEEHKKELTDLASGDMKSALPSVN